MKFRSQGVKEPRGQVQVCSVGPRVDAAPAGLAPLCLWPIPKRGRKETKRSPQTSAAAPKRGRPFAALCIPTDTRSMSSASRPEFCAAWYDVSSRGWCRWSLGLQCLPADGRALRPADRNAWRQCVEAHAALERCLHPSAQSRLGTGAEDAEGAAGCSNSFALSCGGGQRVGAFSPRHRKPCICAEFRPPGRVEPFSPRR